MKYWSGTLLAFLGWLLVAPGSAVAGCSSHDVPTKSLISLSVGSGLGLDTLDLAGALAVADMAETPRGPEPCTGGMCSGRRPLPVSPAPPQVLRIGMWAILEIATPIASPERADSRHDDGLVCPTRCATMIFHPPRLAASHLAA